MPTLPAFTKEISILHSFGYEEQDFASVIDALAQGRLVVAPMNTATICLAELPTLFEQLRNDPAHRKVLMDPARI